jgi:hypothetical protein
MRGSYSIKEVLPAMVPELSYDGMEVADGMAAMQAYHDMCAMEPGAELDRLRAAMLEYCRLDTLGMVRILGELGLMDGKSVDCNLEVTDCDLKTGSRRSAYTALKQ